MADRILLRGGHVLTVDPQLGDIEGGDVLIEGDTIVQVGKDLSADAEVIDCSGSVVIPGFVDTHRHTWEAAIRSCAPNATLDDYFVEVLDSFAPLYRPEDVYAERPRGRARVHQRRHHHARRLVAHQQHARSSGRGDPRPEGSGHPLALRVRQREHVAGGLLVQQLDRHPA